MSVPMVIDSGAVVMRSKNLAPAMSLPSEGTGMPNVQGQVGPFSPHNPTTVQQLGIVVGASPGQVADVAAGVALQVASQAQVRIDEITSAQEQREQGLVDQALKQGIQQGAAAQQAQDEAVAQQLMGQAQQRGAESQLALDKAEAQRRENSYAANQNELVASHQMVLRQKDDAHSLLQKEVEKARRERSESREAHQRLIQKAASDEHARSKLYYDTQLRDQEQAYKKALDEQWSLNQKLERDVLALSSLPALQPTCRTPGVRVDLPKKDPSPLENASSFGPAGGTGVTGSRYLQKNSQAIMA